MDTVIGAIIALVIIVLSIARTIQEQREAARRARAPKTRPEDLPESTRRILYGEPVVREAVPKGGEGEGVEGAPRPVRPRGEGAPSPAKELLETLFGVELEEGEEGEWRPVQRPAERREIPKQVQAEREQPRRRPAPERRMMPQGERRPVPVPVPRPKERGRPRPEGRAPAPMPVRVAGGEPEEGPKQKVLQPYTMAQALAEAGRPERPVGAGMKRHARLLGSMADVRRAVVLMEVLGPPRGLSSLDAHWMLNRAE